MKEKIRNISGAIASVTPPSHGPGIAPYSKCRPNATAPLAAGFPVPPRAPIAVPTPTPQTVKVVLLDDEARSLVARWNAAPLGQTTVLSRAYGATLRAALVTDRLEREANERLIKRSKERETKGTLDYGPYCTPALESSRRLAALHAAAVARNRAALNHLMEFYRDELQREHDAEMSCRRLVDAHPAEVLMTVKSPSPR